MRTAEVEVEEEGPWIEEGGASGPPQLLVEGPMRMA
jgi:hypothetical protein